MLRHNLTFVQKHDRNSREQEMMEECTGEIVPGLVVVVMVMMTTTMMMHRSHCALGIMLSARHG